MKVLNFEDSVYKANAIRKILGNRCGVASVEQVSNVEDGLKMLKDAENAGEPFNLIITDMHFPMRSGAISDTEAGEKLVQILQAQGNQPTLSYVFRNMNFQVCMDVSGIRKSVTGKKNFVIL